MQAGVSLPRQTGSFTLMERGPIAIPGRQAGGVGNDLFIFLFISFYLLMSLLIPQKRAREGYEEFQELEDSNFSNWFFSSTN